MKVSEDLKLERGEQQKESMDLHERAKNADLENSMFD